MSHDFESFQFDCTGSILFDSKIANREVPVKTDQIWPGSVIGSFLANNEYILISF